VCLHRMSGTEGRPLLLRERMHVLESRLDPAIFFGVIAQPSCASIQCAQSEQARATITSSCLPVEQLLP
jgi:hypothetical protein